IVSLKDLDLNTISESHLMSSYIHPMIQCIFDLNDDYKIAHRSNILEDENGLDQRPDYVVDVYEDYRLSHQTCFGEIKPNGSPHTKTIVDFYRLAIFSKNTLEQHNLNGVVSFQTIGSFTTFYLTALVNDFYVMTELTTIRLPMTKPFVLDLILCLDDLLSICTLHHSLSKLPSTQVVPTTLTVPFSLINITKTIPAKRRPSLSSIAASSSQQ
ncbi:hypothetical protein DM01DRAFT_1283801, partial [Hesseltinella vesiculosa]